MQSCLRVFFLLFVFLFFFFKLCSLLSEISAYSGGIRFTFSGTKRPRPGHWKLQTHKGCPHTFGHYVYSCAHAVQGFRFTSRVFSGVFNTRTGRGLFKQLSSWHTQAGSDLWGGPPSSWSMKYHIVELGAPNYDQLAFNYCLNLNSGAAVQKSTVWNRFLDFARQTSEKLCRALRRLWPN